MGRTSTFPELFEDKKSISISKLKQWNYLNENTVLSGTITWSRLETPNGSISIAVNTIDNYIELDYTFQKTQKINYRVQLVTVPSNLGKGFQWFFKCPFSLKYCRKLYLDNGYFKSREAIKDTLYQKQVESKRYRYLTKLWEASKAMETIYTTKHFVKNYNGKPTKRFNKILNLERKGLTGFDIETLLCL